MPRPPRVLKRSLHKPLPQTRRAPSRPHVKPLHLTEIFCQRPNRHATRRFLSSDPKQQRPARRRKVARKPAEFLLKILIGKVHANRRPILAHQATHRRNFLRRHRVNDPHISALRSHRRHRPRFFSSPTRCAHSVPPTSAILAHPTVPPVYPEYRRETASSPRTWSGPAFLSQPASSSQTRAKPPPNRRSLQNQRGLGKRKNCLCPNLRCLLSTI